MTLSTYLALSSAYLLAIAIIFCFMRGAFGWSNEVKMGAAPSQDASHE